MPVRQVAPTASVSVVRSLLKTVKNEIVVAG